MATAGCRERLLGGAGALADWIQLRAESVNCPRPEGAAPGLTGPALLHGRLGTSLPPLLPTLRLCLYMPASRLPEPQLSLLRDQAPMRIQCPALWGAASPQGPCALLLEGPQDTFLQAAGTTNGLPSTQAWELEVAVQGLAPCRAGLLAGCMAPPLDGQRGASAPAGALAPLLLPK
ncbi:uncharacterized protein LOC118146229 isoform X2 [Callithrix jacchus]